MESELNSKNARTHVDSNTLPSKSARSTDAVNIIFTVSGGESKVQVFHSTIAQKHARGQIVVNHK